MRKWPKLMLPGSYGVCRRGAEIRRGQAVLRDANHDPPAIGLASGAKRVSLSAPARTGVREDSEPSRTRYGSPLYTKSVVTVILRDRIEGDAMSCCESDRALRCDCRNVITSS